MPDVRVATVRAIVRYPVKSMPGEELASAELGFQGVPGDRRYAFVQAGARSLFPWLTAREYPELLRYRPAFQGDGRERPRLFVTTPSGVPLSIDSDELLRRIEEGSGRAVFLLRDHRGSYDIAPISLISLGTTARIAEESDTPHDPARFRANLYVEADGGGPFAEDAWVGRILRIGGTARLAVTEPDERCAMITLDPRTGEARPEVLRSVAQIHGNRAGVYGTVLTPGEIGVGDRVYLET